MPNGAPSNGKPADKPKDKPIPQAERQARQAALRKLLVQSAADNLAATDNRAELAARWQQYIDKLAHKADR